MKPNPHIALIYHYDLARALTGETVDWVAIPVNVDAGREGGDLCRAAADFGKRRDLFAMPAPTSGEPCSDTTSTPNLIRRPATTSDASNSPTLPAKTNLTAATTSTSGSSPTLNRSTSPSTSSDLFAVPAPPVAVEQPAVTEVQITADATAFAAEVEKIKNLTVDRDAVDLFAVPADPPVAVEQCAVDPGSDTASPPVPASAAEWAQEAYDAIPLPEYAADRDRLRARIAGLVHQNPDGERLLRAWWPEGVPTLKHDGHTPDQLDQILAAVRRVETEVGAGWHPDDDPQPHSRTAIERALAAWADRDPGTAWFAASLIATFEQCRNADATFEDLVGQFTIEQADRLHDAAQAAANQ